MMEVANTTNVAESKMNYVYSDTLQFEVVKGKDGKDHYQTKGFVAMGNKDKVGDIITPEAIKGMVDQINNSKTYFYGSHDHEHISSGDRSIPPRARITGAEEAEKACKDGQVYKGVWITDELNEYHPEFKNYKGMIENNWLGSYSIEFLKPRPDEFMRTEDGGRILNHVNMTGYAHTARPINPECSMSKFVAKSLSDIDNHTAEDDVCAADSVDAKPEVKMEEEKVETPEEKPEEKAPEEEAPEAPAPEAPAPAAPAEPKPEPEATPEEPAAEPEAPAEEAKSELLKELKQLREEIKSLKEDTKAKNLLPAKEKKFEEAKALDGSFAEIYERQLGLGGKK